MTKDEEDELLVSICVESIRTVRGMSDEAIYEEFQNTPIGNRRDMMLRFEMARRWATFRAYSNDVTTTSPRKWRRL